MPVNQYGYRFDHCIGLRECRQLLRHYVETNFGQAEVLFRSLRELCRLTPGADRLVMTRYRSRDNQQQKFDKMVSYLQEVYLVVDELEWGRVNQEAWALNDINNETLSVNMTNSVNVTQNTTHNDSNSTRGVGNHVNDSAGNGSANPSDISTDNTTSIVTARTNVTGNSGIHTDNTTQQSVPQVNVSNMANDSQRMNHVNNNNRSTQGQGQGYNTSTPIQQMGPMAMMNDLQRQFPNLTWNPIDGWVMQNEAHPQTKPVGVGLSGRTQVPVPQVVPRWEQQSPGYMHGDYSNEVVNHDTRNASHSRNTGIELMVEQQRQQQKDMAQLQLFSQCYEKLDGSEYNKYKPWAESVQKRILLSKADNDIALAHIKVCLEGNALSMYENATDHVRGSVSETWRFLESRFGEKRCAAVRESTFLTCDQSPTMNIRQYLVELESRCFLVREQTGYDTVMLQRMCTGLREQQWRVMATEAILKDSSTRLDDLVKAIEIRENSLKIQNAQFRQIQSATGHTNKNPYYGNKTSNGQNEDSGGNTRPYCTYCQKMGHIVIECNKKLNETRHKDYDRGASGTQGQNYGANGGYSSFQGQNRPMTPSTQHMNMGAQRSGYQNRPNGQIRDTFSGTCNKCQQIGHKLKDCPKRDNMVNMVRNCQGQATDQVAQDRKCGNDDKSEDGGGQMMMIVQDHNLTVTTEVSPAQAIMAVQAKKVEKEPQEKGERLYLVVNGELLTNDRYLLDTGASGNMIGLKYVKLLQEKGLMDQKQPCSCNFEGFTGAKVVCLGKHRLSVSLAGKPSYHADFHVTPHLEARNYDIVLGRNALQEMGVKLMCNGIELNMNLMNNGHVVHEKDEGEVKKSDVKKRRNHHGKKIGLAQVDKQPNWKKGTGGHVNMNHKSFQCLRVKSVNEIVNSQIPTDQSHRKFSCNGQMYNNSECWFPGNATKSDYYGYGKQVKMKNSNMRPLQSRQNWQRDNSGFRQYRSCYRCGQQGHIQRNCPFKMKQLWIEDSGGVEQTYE